MWLIWLGAAGTILSFVVGLLAGGRLGLALLFIALPISVAHLVAGAVAVAVTLRAQDGPPGG